MNPQVEFLPDGRQVKLLEDLTFTDSNKRVWAASEGLISDGASIPRIVWWCVGSPFTGQYRRAAIFHDGYYTHHNNRKREDVDDMFYEIMRADDVGAIKAWVIYNAVRLFGWKAWRENG